MREHPPTDPVALSAAGQPPVESAPHGPEAPAACGADTSADMTEGLVIPDEADVTDEATIAADDTGIALGGLRTVTAAETSGQQAAAAEENDPSDHIDQLARQAQTGDRAAIGALLAELQPLVVRYARARIGGREQRLHSADDTAQDVLLAALQALPAFQWRGRSFLAFTYAIARHKVMDVYRSGAKDRSAPYDDLPDTPTGNLPEDSALAVTQSETLRQLLEKLPPRQREILVLRVALGHTALETGELLGGVSEVAVRVGQHRALRRLRELTAAMNIWDDQRRADSIDDSPR